MAAWTIARYTVLELARKRVLLAILVVSLLAVGLSTWGFAKLAEQTGSRLQLTITVSQLLIFLAFMFSGLLALAGAFSAAPAIGADIESGLMLSILPRPVRRWQVVAGRWLGLAMVAVAFTAGICCLELLAGYFTTGYLPPHPYQLMGYLALEALVVMSLGILLSTRLPTVAAGFVAFAAWLGAWIADVIGGIGEAVHNQPVAMVGTVSKFVFPSGAAWKGAVFALEPQTIITSFRATAAANPFFADQPPPTPLLVWTGLWIVLVVGAAAWSFQRREI